MARRTKTEAACPCGRGLPYAECCAPAHRGQAPASAESLVNIDQRLSSLTDRTVVDGLVNLVGRICEEGSFWLRKVQTGLVQNYALLTLFGVFAFLTVYLFVR